MSKKGLPLGLKMRHDSHYVEELTHTPRYIGRVIQISKIEPNPDQPRVEMGDLTGLVASIKEKGVLEPLLVKPLERSDKWLIIAGERRWRAAQLAGLVEVPCVELKVNEQEVAEIALIENLQRKDLTVWEEADAYRALCQKFNYTHEDLAKKLSKSRSSVTETLTIGALPMGIRHKCIESGISSKAAILKIARKFDEREMLSEIDKSLDIFNSSNQEHSLQNESPKTNSSNSNALKSRTQYIQEAKTVANLSSVFPLKIFKFEESSGDFKLEIKFRKPSEKEDVKKALNIILNKLQNVSNE